MAEINVDLIPAFAPEQEEQGIGDAVTDLTSLTPEDSKHGNLLAGQTVVVDERDQDISEYSVAVQNPDKEGSYRRAVDARKDQVVQGAQQILEATLATDPEHFESQVVETQQIIDEQEQSDISDERAVVRSVTSKAPIDVGPRIRDEEAFRLAAMNDVTSLLHNQGTLETIADYAGLFMPFNLALDLEDVLDNKFDFTNATDIEAFVIDFQALPVERKREYWPAIVESVLAATGTGIDGHEVSDDNVVKASGILLSMLNPEGASALNFQENLDLLFGIADVAPVVGLMGSAAVHALRSNNLVKKTAKLGDVERAANMNMAAMSDDSAATTLGLSRQEAATNALPIDQSGWRPEFAKDIAPEISKKLNEFQRQAEGITTSFRDESIFIKEGLLRKSEKERVIKDFTEELRSVGKGEDVLNEGIHINNIRVASSDETGFIVKYDILKEGVRQESRQVRRATERAIAKLEERIARGRDADIPALEAQLVELRASRVTQVAEPQEQAVRWEIDQATGTFKETIENAIPGFEYGVSPAAWARTGEGGDFLASFKSASNIADLAAAAQGKMLELVKASNKPTSGVLNKKARDRVAAVEIAGDEFIDPATGIRGKTFSPDELRKGINTREGTTKLQSPAEQETYYNHRIVADQFWQLENHAARRRLELLGFNSEVTLNGAKAIASPFDTAQAAKSSISKKQGFHAFDNRDFDSAELTDEFVDKLYDDGYVLVRLADDTPVQHLDGVVEHFDYAVVQRGDLGAMPQQVTHYKPGYVPKINKGVEYLVKENVPGVKRGVEGFTRKVTHRFFASKQDAETYRAEQVQRFINENPEIDMATADQRFAVLADREQTPMSRVHESAGSSGGLYTGARASHDIASGLSGVRTDRVSPFEAFQRNAQHIGSLVTRNEWRLGEEQRWLNTVEAYGIENRGFRGTTLPDDKTGRALERQRQLIEQWNGIPTVDESAFQGVIQNLHDWTLTGLRKTTGLNDKENVKSLLWLKHTDPAAAAKSVAFNLALGILNPAQLFVQASAVTVALSRFPRIAPTTVGYAAKLAWTDRMREAGTAARTSKLFTDKDTPLFEEVRLAWERSGLRESVRQNADLNSADAYGVMTLDALKRVSDANLILYRQGELMNRRVSFTASYLDWKRKNPGKTPDNDALRSIKADANLSMLELNHANRAMWQGGPDTGTLRNILGVMTQFQQVGAKALELLVKGPQRGGFSGREKTRIMLAQAGLYGAAGIPLGNAIVSSAADWLEADMDEDAREAWNQGLTGVLWVNALGADVEIAPRLAPFGQTAQFIRDLMFDDVPFAEKALGVFGDMRGRMGDAFARLRPMLMGGLKGREMSRPELLQAMSLLASVPSSSRGLVKAWIMHNQHKILDRHGRAVVVQDFNAQTEIATALGFRPTAESETRIIQMSNKDFTQLVTDYSDVVMDLYSKYLAIADDDPAAGEKLSRAMQVLFESLDNPMLEARVRESVGRKVAEGTSVRDKEIKKFFERTMPEEIEGGAKAIRDNFFTRAVQERAIVQPLEAGE